MAEGGDILKLLKKRNSKFIKLSKMLEKI